MSILKFSTHLCKAVVLAGTALFVCSQPVWAKSSAAVIDDDRRWPSIREDLFGKRPIAEEDGTIKLDAPYRAQDAAIVPISVTIPKGIAANVKTLTLVVEKNPAPLVAKFTFGPAAGIAERRISTRVRVDAYSNVTAVIETKDGALHMTTRFVKAAGGCSAPSQKDADAALANLGKIKLRKLPPAQASSASREAQVMVRHPNYSGFQMNQLTLLYIPAKYVEHIEIRKNDRLVFTMEGGISLSEDPNIRFTYEGGTPGPLSVSVRDTDGKVFKASTAHTASN